MPNFPSSSSSSDDDGGDDDGGDGDDWPVLDASPMDARASATTDATASINKRDIARLARVSCGGSIWSLSTPPARFSYWKLWSPIESPKSVVCTI